jgi:hypothetical protein
MLGPMRFRRVPPSWRISVGDREALAIALWLRDASGMAPDLDPAIPPLDPPVEVRADLAALAVPQAVAQWTGLWIGLWEGRLEEWFVLGMIGPPGYELLAQSPQLRELTAAGFEEAVKWSVRHRPFRNESPTQPTSAERLPWQVVKELEKAAGHPAKEFSLDVRILPVAGREFWMLPDDQLVVSESLVRDPTAFRALLHDVLKPLV